MKVYVDASPTATAYVAEDGKTGIYKFLGDHTNNEAEYLAVNHALTSVKNVSEILSDSQLIVNQLNHKYHIKKDRLRLLAMEIWRLSNGKVKFTWIPREQNPAGKLLG